MSEDPVGFNAGDVNLYRCVFNNPIDFLDPLGLECAPSGTKWEQYQKYIEGSHESGSNAPIGGIKLSEALLGLASYHLGFVGERMLSTSEVLFGTSMAAYATAGISELASGGLSTPISLASASYASYSLLGSTYTAVTGTLCLGASQFAKGEYAEGSITLLMSVSGKPAEHIAEILGARPALQAFSGWILEKYSESVVHQ